MKPLSRRSVTTGLAAAVMAVPALGLAEAPIEKVKRLARELEPGHAGCLPRHGGHIARLPRR